MDKRRNLFLGVSLWWLASVTQWLPNISSLGYLKTMQCKHIECFDSLLGVDLGKAHHHLKEFQIFVFSYNFPKMFSVMDCLHLEVTWPHLPKSSNVNNNNNNVRCLYSTFYNCLNAPKLIEGMVRKPIVLSLLFAFDVEPVLTVHKVELVFIRTWKIRKTKLCLCNYGKEHSNIY